MCSFQYSDTEECIPIFQVFYCLSHLEQSEEWSSVLSSHTALARFIHSWKETRIWTFLT